LQSLKSDLRSVNGTHKFNSHGFLLKGRKRGTRPLFLLKNVLEEKTSRILS